MKIFLKYSLIPLMFLITLIIPKWQIFLLQKEAEEEKVSYEIMQSELNIAIIQLRVIEEAAKVPCVKSMKLISPLTSHDYEEIKCSHPDHIANLDILTYSNRILFCSCPNDKWDFKWTYPNEVVR